jgi:hypothetical protein
MANLNQKVDGGATAGDPSPSQHGLQNKRKRDYNIENFVADVGPQYAHDSRRQQNKNKAYNGEDSWREHVQLQSFVSGPLPHFRPEMAINASRGG